MRDFFYMLFIFCMSLTPLGCAPSAYIPPIEDLPIYNPLRSGARFKLGILPPLSHAQVSPKVDIQWTNTLAFFSEGLALYPKILPAVDQSAIYQANHKGQLVSLNKTNGSTFWRSNLSHKVASGPMIVNDLLLVGTQDAQIIAINKKTGRLEWTTEISSEALASPAGDGKRVVVHTVDGKITGLDAQNGHILWTYDSLMPALMLRGSSAPQIQNNMVLAGLANGKLIALHADSGLLAWEKVIAVPKGRLDLQRMVDIRADLLLDGANVFVAAFQGKVASIHIETGTIQWQRELSVYQTMSMDAQSLYLTDENNHVWALDKATGEIRWEQDNLAERYITAPARMNDFVLVADKGGYIHFLDKNTGQIKARYLVGSKIVSDLIIDQNRVLVTTQNGRLSLLKVLL